MFIDPAIRDYVLLPIFALVTIVTYSRNYLMQLISSRPEPSREELEQKGVVARSARLRSYYGYISPQGFHARKEYLLQEKTGKLQAEVQDSNPMMQSNPMTMFEPIKQQLVFMGSQIGIGMLISSYLTGFITLKLPFSLTERFKSVTQSGIAAPGLSSSFVSASSWYYVLAFGLPPLFRLFTRTKGSGSDSDAGLDEARMMQMQMGMGMMPGAAGGPGGGPWMAKTAYANEKSALATVEWTADASPLVAAEADLLREARGGAAAVRKGASGRSAERSLPGAEGRPKNE